MNPEQRKHIEKGGHGLQFWREGDKPLCPVHQQPVLFEENPDEKEWECWCVYAECSSRLGLGSTKKGAYNAFLSKVKGDQGHG